MPRKHQLFTKSELQQTQTILSSSDFGSRPLVKGFTIDSETSMDLDDALWVETYGNIGKIQIHIADPTEVIDIDSPLDKAVRKRIETLYLAKGLIPMLPPALSEQKLSLLEGEPRLTITVEIEINQKGEIVNYRIFESCFISLGKLSYTEVEAIGNKPDHQLFLPVQSAQIWAKVLNKLRVKHGAFVGIIQGNYYINEDGDIEKIACNSQVLIAEYMILANTVVAQWLAEKSLNSLYRNHAVQGDFPQDINWQELDPEESKNFRSQYSHCLDKAVYSPVCQGHFALATPHYLHFTSPLRRFADFIVHRIVKAELKGEKSPYTLEELTNLAEEINQFKLEQKEKQVNYLKDKRDKTLLKTTNYSDLEVKDFSRLIELSLNRNSLDKIKDELKIRLLAKQLTNTDLSLILFQTQDQELHQLILENLDEKILANLMDNCPNILKNMNGVEYEEVICNPVQQIFIGRLIVTINNQELTTSEVIKGKSKKDAKTQACQAWLEAYINQELVPPSEMSQELETDIIPEIPDVIELKHEVPISTLNNLCQQKKWKKPKLNFEESNGIFVCSATLKTEEKTITKIGKATKKKTAQNVAFDLILIELETVELSGTS